MPETTFANGTHTNYDTQGWKYFMMEMDGVTDKTRRKWQIRLYTVNSFTTT